jgi:hypothetical protein
MEPGGFSIHRLGLVIFGKNKSTENSNLENSIVFFKILINFY